MSTPAAESLGGCGGAKESYGSRRFALGLVHSYLGACRLSDAIAALTGASRRQGLRAMDDQRERLTFCRTRALVGRGRGGSW